MTSITNAQFEGKRTMIRKAVMTRKHLFENEQQFSVRNA